MRLLRLAVGQLGAVARAEIAPGPGLCVLHGPNDLGKSTLAQALRMALLLPATSRGADPWRPWQGGGAPTVDATFEFGPQQLVRVRKEFAGPRGSAKLETSRDGRTFHEELAGRAVDGELRRRLQWGIPEPGGAGGQHGLPTSYLVTALLGAQDRVTEVLGADLDADRDTTGRDRIADALQALARDPLFVGVLAETQARFEEVWTATGNLRRTGRLKEASEDVARAERVANAQRALVADTEVVRNELGRDDRSGARGDLARARTEARDARDALADHQRRGGLGAAVEAAAAAVAAHERADAALAEARAEVATREAEARAAEEARADARRARETAEAAVRAAESDGDGAAEAAARQRLADLGLAEADAGRDLAQARALRDDALRREAARDALARAREADAAAAEASARATAAAEAARDARDAWEAHGARVAAEEALARLERAERELAAARAAEDAGVAAEATAAARLAEARAAARAAEEAERVARAEAEEGGADHAVAERTLAAERAAAARDALRRAHARRAEAEAAATAAGTARAHALALAEAAANADRAAERARAASGDWVALEASLDALDRRAAAEGVRERRAAHARAAAELADAGARVAALEAGRARRVVPDRAALAGLRALQAELDGARSALSVGLTLHVAPRRPVDLELRADGAPGLTLTAASPIVLEARATAVLVLPDAVVTVTGGGREALARVTALEARVAAELAPALASAGVPDLAGLEGAVEQAADLDRELAAARAEAARAARARDALPPVGEAPPTDGPEPDPRALALAAASADPRGAWRRERDALAAATAKAEAEAGAARTRAAVAAAAAEAAERAAAAHAEVLAAPPPEPLGPADAAAEAAAAALASLSRGLAERRAAAEAATARAAAAREAARAAEAEAERAHAAAGVESGRRAGQRSAQAAAVEALDPGAVRAGLAALEPAPPGWSGRAGWERERAARQRAATEAEVARQRAETAAAVAAEAHSRAEAAWTGHAPAPAPAEAEQRLAEVAARAQAASEALGRAEAELEAQRGARSAVQRHAEEALTGASEAQRAAEAAADAATDALGRARGRVDALAALPTGDRAEAARRLAEARAAAGDLPGAEALAGAELAVAQAQARLEAAEATYQRLQGALDHVGGTVAEERLAEAEQALSLARAREREVQVESEAWKLLRDVLLAAERDQAANLGGVLGPLLGDRLRDLAGPRYERVLLAPHLRAEGVVVGGVPRDPAALSVGTREQLATLVRLCLAERLGTMLVLDDPLVQSDAARSGWFGRALLEVGRRVQILVFTCRPGDYPPPGEGVTHVDLGAAIQPHGTR